MCIYTIYLCFTQNSCKRYQVKHDRAKPARGHTTQKYINTHPRCMHCVEHSLTPLSSVETDSSFCDSLQSMEQQVTPMQAQ